MIEKTSQNVKCKYCGCVATTTYQGIPCCDDCAQSEELLEDIKLVESFEETK